MELRPRKTQVILDFPRVSSKTATGLAKGKTALREEQDEAYSPLSNTFKVLAVGKEVEDIKVGDNVILNANITPQPFYFGINQDKDEEAKRVVFVNEYDIVAISPVEYKIKKTSTNSILPLFPNN
jgi:co-chaperonin GroES (HSP10)